MEGHCRMISLRLTLAFTIATVLTSVLPAAAQSPGGHATVLNYSYPEVWDPHLAGTLGALAAISPMYSQVVEFNPLKPTEIIGDLAKTWEAADDGLTYVFHLHESAKWWDGKDLTAEDVAFSINRMIEPGKARPRVGVLRSMVKRADAVDRNTVKIFLNYASPSFLQFLAVDYMKVLPKHLLAAGVDINQWNNIVGSGPYKIVNAKRGVSVEYERNASYFKKGRPYVDRLTMRAISDKGTIAAAFRTGKITLTTATFNLDVEDALRLSNDLKAKYTLYWQPTNAMQHFFFNVTKSPWNNLKIVKALRLATDRHEIQRAFGSGRYELGAPFRVGAWYASARDELLKLPGYQVPKERDVQEAKMLLKEAGYDPPSRLGKIALTVPGILFYPDLAQLWAAQMKRNLGLEVELRVVDTPTAVTAFTSGNFDVGVFGYGFTIDDPDDYVDALYGPGGRNWSRWKNPRFDEMLKAQARELNREKRRAILRSMEQFLLTEEDPYIEAMWIPWFYFVSNSVQTEAGSFVPATSIQTVLKQDHWWLRR
jgi:peptide/nickel transport system substrate-binding protein